MVRVGDTAPDFMAVLAGGEAYNDIRPFALYEALKAGPVVLAFYPAAFTSGCTTEMCTFRDRLPDFSAHDAHVFGVSVDLPFAQNIWIEQESLNFPMISDWGHDIIHAYDVVLPDMYDAIEVAQRSVFVIDTDGTVQYAWVRDGDNPDFDELVDEVQDVVAGL